MLVIPFKSNRAKRNDSHTAWITMRAAGAENKHVFQPEHGPNVLIFINHHRAVIFTLELIVLVNKESQIEARQLNRQVASRGKSDREMFDTLDWQQRS